MSIIWIYVMSSVRLAGWSVLRNTIFNVWHYIQTVLPNCFHTCMLFHTCINFYQFIALTVLDLAWGSQGQHKAGPIGFIFLHIFDPIRIKFDVMMEQVKLSLHRLFWVNFCERRRTTTVLLSVSKKSLTLTCIQTFMNGFDSSSSSSVFPAISLGFTIYQWDFYICNHFLIQLLR